MQNLPISHPLSNHPVKLIFPKINFQFVFYFLSLLLQVLLPLPKISQFPFLTHSYLSFRAQCLHYDTAYGKMVLTIHLNFLLMQRPPLLETGVNYIFQNFVAWVGQKGSISQTCSKFGSHKGDRDLLLMLFLLADKVWVEFPGKTPAAVVMYSHWLHGCHRYRALDLLMRITGQKLLQFLSAS